MAEVATSPPALQFPDPTHFRALLGQHDEHVRLVERALGVRAIVGEGTITLEGDPVETELGGRVLEQLYGLIEKDLGFGDLITLLKLKADGVYLEEITLPATSSKLGKRLKDVGLPANASVMAILAADGYIQAPHGETPLVEGDQLLLLVEGDVDEATIRSAFGIPLDEAD